MGRWLSAVLLLSAVTACTGELVFPGGIDGAAGADPGDAGSGEPPVIEWPDYGVVGGIPTHHPELLEWLQAGGYESWPGQSGLYSSMQHGTQRIYYNQALVDSLLADHETHPVGVAAIREIYWQGGGDVLLSGWSVMIKIQSDSADGDGWYFYSINTMIDTDPGNARTGVNYCMSCHRRAPYDLIHAPFALEPG